MGSEKAKAEFTIEPFMEGEPGPHVKETIAVAKQSGLDVEIGPFGTTVIGEQETVFELVSELVKTAMDNGASRISLQVTSI
ncbi:MAG: thiamine-binding protein [Acidimicrobiales bacterium]|nr:thiamine-binding protein [Acidimicrobiales bacterium]